MAKIGSEGCGSPCSIWQIMHVTKHAGATDVRLSRIEIHIETTSSVAVPEGLTCAPPSIFDFPESNNPLKWLVISQRRPQRSVNTQERKPLSSLPVRAVELAPLAPSTVNTVAN